LFITQLAFVDAALAASAKLGVFAASVGAAVIGGATLRLAHK
jgi:Na+/H+ antiporter NhaA